MDASIVWAVGTTSTSTGVILKMTDGGATIWTSQTVPVGTQALTDVFAVDASTAWAVGNGGALLKTINGGTNWLAQTHPAGTATFDGVAAVNANVARVVGSGGTILKTIDGGATTWTVDTGGGTNSLQDVAAPTPGTAYAVGDDNGDPAVGKIFKTGGSSVVSYSVSIQVVVVDTAFAALSGSGSGLDQGLQTNQVGNLAAQTLTLAFNTVEVPGFAQQTLVALGCGSANTADGLGAFNPGELTDGSTMLQVLSRANFLLNGSVSGAPVVTVQQLTAMTSLLGHCANSE